MLSDILHVTYMSRSPQGLHWPFVIDKSNEINGIYSLSSLPLHMYELFGRRGLFYELIWFTED